MKRGIVIAGSMIGAAALVYLEASLAFVGRFPFRTTINGEDVSLQTVAQASESLRAKASDYVLTLTGRNNVSDTISAQDISLTIYPETELAAKVRECGFLRWPLALINAVADTTTAENEFNEEQLTSILTATAFYNEANVIPPTNASYQLIDGTYQIVPEEQGAQLDDSKALSAVALAIANGETTLDLDAADCYLAPSITAENGTLSADVETLNQYVDLEIHIPIGAGDGEQIDAATIVGWVVNESEEELAADAATAASGESTSSEGDGSESVLPTGFTFDSSKITEYVESLAEKYNTYGTTHTFTTQAGDDIEISIGNYGWWLNEEATAEAILNALKSGTGGEVEPVWVQQAARWPTEENGNNDIGDTYAEVDLDNQHVYMVVDGEVVMDMDCVSGKATDGHATPDGLYRLTFKQRDATLVGEGYASPVKYWMPFNLGVGFHDASWRSSFGGKIYVTSGSHGCVNLPPSMAGEFFDYVYTGMPVIVYGGMTQEEAREYAGLNGSTAGTGTSHSSSSSSGSKKPNDDADNEETDAEAAAAAQAAADQATEQVTQAAQQIASQIYEQQIKAGATESDALAAAQAAANEAVANATGAAQ